MWAIWSARRSALLMRFTTSGTEFDRIERLVGVHRAGSVGVGGHLPAGQVDRLQPGLDLLHGLVAGQRAEGVDVGLAVQQVPEARAPFSASVCLMRNEPRDAPTSAGV